MENDRRDQLIEYIEKEFIGPDPIDWLDMTQKNGEEILTTDPPRTRYIAGILYPRETTDTDADTREGESVPLEESEAEDPDTVPVKNAGGSTEFLENAEELINRSNAYRQSAISITVAIKDNDKIRVEVSAGTYDNLTVTDPKTEKRVTSYPRTALFWGNDGTPLILPAPISPVQKSRVRDTGLQLDITYRYRMGDSTIYTFTLENTNQKKGDSVRDEDCFFQVRFKLLSEKGFSPLPEGQRITEDEDYRSNLLLYRNVHNYAIGHGCAADWEDAETVRWISTAIFPKYDIKPIVPSRIEGVSLEMSKMSPYGNFQDTVKELQLMCEKYRVWIDDLRAVRKDLAAQYTATADRHISNCETCLSRMA